MKKLSVKVIKATGSSKMQESKSIEQDPSAFGEFLCPPYNKINLFNMKEESTILQQCIEAYKQNIVGFGAAIKYTIDETLSDETPEMKSEWNTLDEFIKYFNFDESFEDVWKSVIDDRESCGEGYIEILRDGTNRPVGGENIDTRYITLTRLSDPIEITYQKEGKSYIRYKRFRKFKQEINGSTVYFKEFGDPRTLDCITGQYLEDVATDNIATELIQIKIGNQAYGIPRWIGATVPLIGARKAEELNYNYFKQGRHTPLAILVKNGVLSEDSEAALADYASSVEGTDNAHKFLLLQMEELKNDDSISLGDDANKNKMDIELKDLAGMLQQDALFLDYDESTRKKIQSSFRLPDIYVGRSNDFNRATAEVAMEITEKQVFIPERKSLAFKINNLLDECQLKYTALYFNAPDISNTDDKVKMIDSLNNAGALAPNDLRDEASKLLGKPLDNFDIDEANIPPILANKSSGDINTLPLLMKAQTNGVSGEIINILKDVRDVIEEFNDGKKD